MSKYTTQGSAELDARIDADLKRIATAAAPHSLAGVLLGGYGRGEGTPFIHPDGTQHPFNDYDLVVIVPRLSPSIKKRFRRLEAQLTAAVGLSVDLCPYLKTQLPHCEFSLLNYEMRRGHRIIWGDEKILSSMPSYPTAELPLVEGPRLLLNRGKLLLDIQQRLATPTPLTPEERICFIKFISKVRLALGDCALLAAGKYSTTYATKRDRILHLEKGPHFETVRQGYLAALDLKEWGDFHALGHVNIRDEFDATRALFLAFLPWMQAQVPSKKQRGPAWIREQLLGILIQLLNEKTPFPPPIFYKLQRRFS